ncbi:MAG: DUF6714 family protein [Verrucomicrobiota bacterium]
MLFLTQKDIDDLRSRGFEEENIYSTPSPERIEQAKQIAEHVTKTFRGIKLGCGIGLHEGQAIDDYESDKERKSKRKKDEKENWSAIRSDTLNTCNSSLSFFDAAGMRFHLPAFICSDLRGEYDQSLEFSLTDLSDWMKEKFMLFTNKEKEAVALYLEFLADDIDSEFSRESIFQALEEYWKK